MAVVKDDDIPALGRPGISSGAHSSFPIVGKRSSAKSQEPLPWGWGEPSSNPHPTPP